MPIPMAAPDWVQQALDGTLDTDEEIVETEELDSGMMSELHVAATSRRGFVIRKKALGGPDIWPFELDVPASGNGSVTPAPETVEEAPEPEPEAAEVDDTEGEDTEPETPSELDDATSESDLTILDGIGEARVATLADHGIETFEDLAAADAEELDEALTVGAETIEAWQAKVDLTRVHGIGPTRSAALRGIGIQTREDLIEADAAEVAEHLDAPQRTVETWQAKARRTRAAPEHLTKVDGIGQARADSLVGAGVTSLLSLVEADPAELADTLNVGEDTVEGWQKIAVELPETDTDLLEIDGVGPARARAMIQQGIPDQAALADTDPAELADAFGVTEDTVAGWRDAAREA